MHFDPGCLPLRAFFRSFSLVTPHRGYISFPFLSTIFYSRRNYSSVLRYRRAIVQTFRYKERRKIEIEIPSSKSRIVYRKRVDIRGDHRKIPRSLRRKITSKRTNVIFPRKLFPLMFSVFRESAANHGDFGKKLDQFAFLCIIPCVLVSRYLKC